MAAEANGVRTRSSARRNGKQPPASQPEQEQTASGTATAIEETKQAHETIKKAQNTPYDHRYGHIDMRDEQIIGGGKERALMRYDPGIVISEKGKEMDKKLDEHYECVRGLRREGMGAWIKSWTMTSSRA